MALTKRQQEILAKIERQPWTKAQKSIEARRYGIGYKPEKPFRHESAPMIPIRQRWGKDETGNLYKILYNNKSLWVEVEAMASKIYNQLKGEHFDISVGSPAPTSPALIQQAGRDLKAEMMQFIQYDIEDEERAEISSAIGPTFEKVDWNKLWLMIASDIFG